MRHWPRGGRRGQTGATCAHQHALEHRPHAPRRALRSGCQEGGRHTGVGAMSAAQRRRGFATWRSARDRVCRHVEKSARRAMRRALAGLLAGCAALLLLLRHVASPAWTPIRVTSATSGVRAANYSSLRAHIAQHVRIHQRATQSRANATARSEDSAAPPTADSVPACQITREAGFNGVRTPRTTRRRPCRLCA